MSDDLVFSDATALAELVRNKAVSPVEIMQAHLDRVERLNPDINAIVTVADDALSACFGKSRTVISLSRGQAFH